MQNSYSSQLNSAEVRKRALQRALTHFFLMLVSLTMITPFVWMVLSSFKSDGEMMAIPMRWLPTVWRTDNYVTTFNMAPWGRYLVNTLVITGSSVLLQLLVASMAAYAFARLQFKLRNLLFVIYLSTMMLPYQVTMVPSFIIIKNFGWIDNHLSLIVPNAFSVFGVFMLRQFFLSIPTELEEAARIDGCGHLRLFWEIIMKNSKPALATLTLFIFKGVWNEFLRPMLYLNKQELWTMSLGLSKFQGNYVSMWSNLMCGAVVTVIPVIIVFMFTQRYFIEGIVASGIKG
jgi:multiple sugar transport system permease protein